MVFRDHRLDEIKQGAALKECRTKRCIVDGCENFLTPYQGPGSDSYCREHQKKLSDYDGLASVKKPYTQYRKSCCERCGYDPAQDPDILELTDVKMRNSAIRAALSVDHIDGNHHNNDPENLQTLCQNCHSIKTILNGDNVRRYKQGPDK